MMTMMNVVMPEWTIDETPPTQRAPRAEASRMKETISTSVWASAAFWLMERAENDADRASALVPVRPLEVMGQALKLKRRSGAAVSGDHGTGPSIGAILQAYAAVNALD